ncbi:porin family protein [Longitalea luteola]|uniref:porin family protein n=1 Tax=Longitalea luteola TaxID=2812563 RepID=UPI001A959AA0|nr:porin family protein [Longitalea luteola]
MKKPFIGFRIMMKYTLVCAALLLASTADAQRFHFGPKLDASYGALKGNGVQNKYSAGFQVGGFVEINIAKHWAIQPELLYSWSQYKKAGDFMTYYNNYGRSAANEKINLGAVSLPLLVRYNFNKTFSILAGPQYSYMIFEDENLLKNGRDALKKSEISANIGAQVNVGSVGFYARYNKGLSDVNDIDDRYEWKSNHIQVGIAVRIM